MAAFKRANKLIRAMQFSLVSQWQIAMAAQMQINQLEQ
jgi:hypothetical protein